MGVTRLAVSSGAGTSGAASERTMSMAGTLADAPRRFMRFGRYPFIDRGWPIAYTDSRQRYRAGSGSNSFAVQMPRACSLAMNLTNAAPASGAAALASTAPSYDV